MDRADKLVAATSFFLTGVAVFGIGSQPGEFYYSVYQGLSPWIYVLGVAYILQLCWVAYIGVNSVRVAGLIGIGIPLLSVPLLSGMEFYARGTDSITHSSYLLDILDTGSLPHRLYAALHAMSTMLIHVLDVSRLGGLTVVSLAGFGVFVCGSYLLARNWPTASRRLIVLTPFLLPFGMPRDTGNYTYFKPFLIAMFMAVFVSSLYYYMQRGDSRFTWLWTLSSMILVFFHPLATISLLLMVGGTWIINRFDRPEAQSRTRSIVPIVTIAVAVFAWSLGILSAPINRLYVLVSSPREFFETLALATEYTSATTSASQSGVPLSEIAFPRFVAIGAFSLIAAGCLIWIIRWRVSEYDPDDRVDRERWVRGKPMVAWVFLGGLFMIFNVVVNILPLLPLRPLAMFLPVAGALFGSVRELSPRSKRALLAAMVLITPFSLITLYADPVTYQPNFQVGSGEADGAVWFVEHTESGSDVVSLSTSIPQLVGYTAGDETRTEHIGDANYVGDVDPTYGSRGDNLNISSGTYYPVSLFDERYATRYRPSQGLQRYVYTPPHDESLERVYSNGQFAVYRSNG